MKLCLGCMEQMGDRMTVCSKCGYKEGTPPKEIYHLPPGTILHNKYIVGKVLGYGGFGVTYIGWDYNLGRKVAIKEFLPGDFSTRMPGQTIVTVYDGEATSQFESGLERFVEEAQRLARFNYVPGIVDIYDTFIENNTGYIVMQCLEGDTVKELLDKYGVMPYESARLIMVEILKTLAVVHQVGIIHRDISPDNVFITNNNEIKVLDFGAARYASTHHSKSLSVILKPGYAPEEQYRTHGNQGPWSDVYAAAATMYKMITGITIEDAMERNIQDNVKSPMELGVDLPESANNAIMNALNIHAEMRTQSAEDFINQLASSEVERVIDKPVKTDSGKIPLWLKITSAAILSLAVIFALLVVTGLLNIAGIGKPDVIADDSTRVPYVINHMKDDGEKKLNDDGFAMMIADRSYDEFAEKDIIKTQTPGSGNTADFCTDKDNHDRYIVFVTVSGGHAPVMVPYVVDMMLEDAQKQLEELGFVVKYEEEYSQTAPEGTVLLQDISNVEYSYGSTIVLTVSKGTMKVDSSKTHRIPNLVGMDYEDAIKKLMAIGMYAQRVEKAGSAEENQVLEQSQTVDAEVPEGTIVTLTVCSNTIVIPNVVYKEEATARQLIEAVGAKVKVTYEKNDRVKSGNVVSQSVTGKSTYGTTVKLVVSTGFEKTTDKPKCPVCGSTTHTQHPKCPVCASADHTQHPICSYCGSIDHATSLHPRCSVCGSTQHLTDGHQKCTYCGSTSHAANNHPKCSVCGSMDHAVHPKCRVCGSTEHTEHPPEVKKCSVCGSTAHTEHPVEKCSICGMTSHKTSMHPKCIYCSSTSHTSENHPKCSVCGSGYHPTGEHPKCSVCGSASHTTTGHPRCTYCSSTDHTASEHPACVYCESMYHTSSNHPKCYYCNSTSHLTNAHPKCSYCSSTSHTTSNHPKCNYCGSTSHATTEHEKCKYCDSMKHSSKTHPRCSVCNSTKHETHPTTYVPELTGVYLGTDFESAEDRIRAKYPQCDNIKIKIREYDYSIYDSGYVVYTSPGAGTAISDNGPLYVYIQK